MDDRRDRSDYGGHAGHAHGMSADADTRALAITLGLIVGFMAVEVGVGVIAHSLALLSDAAHMLTDAAAIGLSLVAVRLAQRPAKGVWTFGFKRVEILSAQFNERRCSCSPGSSSTKRSVACSHPRTCAAG